MADKLGLATISELFDKAFSQPGVFRGIPKDSYDVWLRIFRYTTNEQLEKAAWYLIEWRDKLSQVAIGEVNWALCEIGDYSGHYSKQDPAFAKVIEKLFHEDDGKGITLAAYRQMDREGGQAIQSHLKGRKDV